MQVTPLELGLATAAVVIAFGPKKLPRRAKHAEPAEQTDLRALVPAYHAAGRAPSPLSTRDASPIYKSEKQYAMAEEQPQFRQMSRLPHEF